MPVDSVTLGEDHFIEFDTVAVVAITLARPPAFSLFGVVSCLLASLGAFVGASNRVPRSRVMSTATNLLGTLVVGIGATLLMDLGAVLLERAFRFPSPNYCLVGRWFSHMREGTFRHASIAASAQKPSECAIGWAAHYVVGVVYALMFVALASETWPARPTLTPALLFGVGTVLVPFLVMQPSFGMGVAASRTPNPTQARLRSLMAHTAYGVGLYVSAVGLSYVLRADA